eukprot:TRINITY_DN8735_c0_g1_i1.p1 TRINITY_DN8735_c0_g1~~TRINITY_DN8735_c0_g1_i1.p1  ORF type:complete len:380 (-),score=47.10 TRINITY_DN8735_c0_g1_i1:131-1192(-)
MTEDNSTIPVSNAIMMRAAACVIAFQIVHSVILLTSQFARIPLPLKHDGNWYVVRSNNTKSIWIAQLSLSIFSIYQATFCILASMSKDAYLCNVYWQNCMFGTCLMLYSLYSFLLLKDLAVEYGRTKFVRLFHRALTIALFGLIPIGAITSFFGLSGKMMQITNRNGDVLFSNEPYCVLQFESWSLILVPVLDMVVTVCCLFLFVQPLLVLRKHAQSQLNMEQRVHALEYNRIIYENVVAGCISVFLTAWIFITILISRIGFKTNLAHIDCVVAVCSGLINTILSAYTTRRGWRIEAASPPLSALQRHDSGGRSRGASIGNTIPVPHPTASTHTEGSSNTGQVMLKVHASSDS